MDSALRQTSANVTKDTLEPTAQTRPVKPLIIVQDMAFVLVTTGAPAIHIGMA